MNSIRKKSHIDVSFEFEYERLTYPKPINHNLRLMFVTPSLSLYEVVERIASEVCSEQSKAIISENYVPSFTESSEAYQVTLTESNWKAGRQTKSGFEPAKKYDVTLRTSDLKKPALSLNLKIQPEDSELRYSDGNQYEAVYGEGTRVQVSTSYCDSPEDAILRVCDLVRSLFGFKLIPDKICRESKLFWKTEVYVRVDVSNTERLKSAVQQSKSILDRARPPSEEKTSDAEGKFLARFSSSRWADIGLPDSDHEVELKLYEPHNPEYCPSALQHPKLEASLSSIDGGKTLPFDDFDQIQNILRSIVLTHCVAAGIGPHEFVADAFFDGSEADEYDWDHPYNRLGLLRKHHHVLERDVWDVVTNPNTAAQRDILSVLLSTYGASYDSLQSEVGLSRRTIRYHVKKLDELGVCSRSQTRPVDVNFPTREVRDLVALILQHAHPGDSPFDFEARVFERKASRMNTQPTPDRSDKEISPHHEVTTEGFVKELMQAHGQVIAMSHVINQNAAVNG
ncbi:winged helix-turn-helix transcriptional regulator [Natrialbaceae archaeon A-CW1-1]